MAGVHPVMEHGGVDIGGGMPGQSPQEKCRFTVGGGMAGTHPGEEQLRVEVGGGLEGAHAAVEEDQDVDVVGSMEGQSRPDQEVVAGLGGPAAGFIGHRASEVSNPKSASTLDL